MRRLGFVLLYLAALPVGLGSAWWALKRVDTTGVAAGPWRVSLLAGGADADLYTRARVALWGLLALNRDETMYYVARHDSAGAPLRSRCSYRISGTAPSARWWSVTAYADDFFLFPNAERRYSVSGANVGVDAQGRFAFTSGPARPSEQAASALPWLPTAGDRGLVFTLRLYQPGDALRSAPQGLAAPGIEALGACP